jgi:arylsulfatase A-like enzyme
MDGAGEDRPANAARHPEPRIEWFNVPLMRDLEIVERPAQQTTLTKRYTQEAREIIRENKDRPFFLYLAYAFPHIPLFASEDFLGKSRRGLYGDVVEELDWSVGQLLDTLSEEGLADNTLVFFTSDNGPWTVMEEMGGSAGLLRGGKGSTWEGGMRVPGIAWWPGTIPGGEVRRDLACTMDLYTTAISLAGGSVPEDREVDGIDMTPMLKGEGPGNRGEYYYYRGTQLYAARIGPHKAHFVERDGYGRSEPAVFDPPEVYHLGVDPGEQYALEEPPTEVMAELEERVEKHRSSIAPVESQLEKKIEE